jgi:hypothetical protein
MKRRSLSLRMIVCAMTLSLTLAGRAQSFQLYSVSNSPPANANATNGASQLPLQPGNNAPDVSSNPSNTVPLIEFEDVPLTVALENLARQANINYMLDPAIGYGQPDSNGQIKEEPLVTHTWKNITALKVFNILCFDYHLTVVRDSGITFLRASGHDLHFVDDINPGDTNVIPLIEFEDVPLSVALENTAKQAGINYTYVPQSATSDPILSIHWENMTATQAFTALCENYDLDVVTNLNGSGFHVGPREQAPPP